MNLQTEVQKRSGKQLCFSSVCVLQTWIRPGGLRCLSLNLGKLQSARGWICSCTFPHVNGSLKLLFLQSERNLREDKGWAEGGEWFKLLPIVVHFASSDRIYFCAAIRLALICFCFCFLFSSSNKAILRSEKMYMFLHVNMFCVGSKSARQHQTSLSIQRKAFCVWFPETWFPCSWAAASYLIVAYLRCTT